MPTPTTDPATPRVILITGLSGSGKSIALNVLEDAGYDCIDNLPVSLFDALVRNLTEQPAETPPLTAIGIDARSRGADFGQLPAMIERLREHGIDCEVVFLDAEDNILIQRFSETRRRHPLTESGRSLEQAIAAERQLLEPLLDLARLQIDTSRTTLHELRDMIRVRVAEHMRGEMSLMLQSFGFKHGVPRNADFVFDARCLPNPYWQPELRPYTGRDEPVRAYLGGELKVTSLVSQISDFMTRWVPCFEKEARSYLTIAIGCTGGQHRSVFVVERLAEFFESQSRKVLVSHRELR